MPRSEWPPAEGMLALFDQHPDLLPRASATADNSDARDRALKHLPCVHCGSESVSALIVAQKKWRRKMWVDLCRECSHWVMDAITRINVNGKGE